MSLEFKVGDRVLFVHHKMDSVDACEIGKIYTVTAVDNSPRAVKPYVLKGTKYGSWWVALECVAPVQLEND